MKEVSKTETISLANPPPPGDFDEHQPPEMRAAKDLARRYCCKSPRRPLRCAAPATFWPLNKTSARTGLRKAAVFIVAAVCDRRIYCGSALRERRYSDQLRPLTAGIQRKANGAMHLLVNRHG